LGKGGIVVHFPERVRDTPAEYVDKRWGQPSFGRGLRHFTGSKALKWMPKQKRARGSPEKNWMEVIRKAMTERNLNECQWEDRKQWSLGVGQCRKTF
jgi:hypothetical protein